MVDLDNKIIHNTLQDYRHGCTKPIQITPDNSGDVFAYKLQTLMENRLPLKDRLLMRRSANTRNQGLIAARSGQLMVAEQLFAETRILFQSDTSSIEGKLLHKSFLEQAEAYLDYRRNNFDRVRNRTSEALEIDVVLEEEYGYEILVLHRIQLVHNLVRTHARGMYFDRAIALAGQLLSYLQGTLEILPISGSWGSERIARQSPELVAAMFAQITSEIALILADQNRLFARDLFALVTPYIQLQANSQSHCHPRAYAWLLLKQAFLNNDRITFLERASHFLAEGRADTPVIWYATVFDLVTLSNELQLPNSDLVRQEVAKDAISWEYLPQKFSLLLVAA